MRAGKRKVVSHDSLTFEVQIRFTCSNLQNIFFDVKQNSFSVVDTQHFACLTLVSRFQNN